MKYLFLLINFLLPLLTKAQDFNYIHYDTKDGLAGSTVYSMCQDKDGFMWFATENGLSRYDGTHFKNFTVKDGLPDNEVLKVFADSKGRVWIATFSKEICFYYQGKIHHRANDSLINKINTTRNVDYITEDDSHFLSFSFNDRIVIITPSDSLIKYKVSDISANLNDAASVFNHDGKIFININFKETYWYDNINLAWNRSDWYIGMNSKKTDSKDSSYVDVNFNSKKKIFNTITIPGKLISYTLGKTNDLEYINTTDGSWSVDIVNLKLNTQYLSGKKIGFLVEDQEKNLWFATMGEGVYKLPSQKVHTILFSPIKNRNEKEIFSLAEYGDQILAGGDFSRTLLVDKDFRWKELSFNKNKFVPFRDPGNNRLYSIKGSKSSTALLGFDDFLIKLENGASVFNYIAPIKSVDKIDNDNFLVGTSSYAFKMRLKDMQITDTLWNERCTKVFYQNNKYYIGTLNGLYEVNNNKSFTYLGNLHPVLKRRITDIKNDLNGTLWITTSDNGIIGIKDGRVKLTINDSMGLSSDNCKSLFVDGNTLWVGTDMGINKIDIGNGQYHITKYSTSDGLPSNVINAIYVKDSTVWVGSPAGLTYFNENSISNYSMCNLKMLKVTVSGKEMPGDSVFKLTYNNNDIHFEYVGISFRSGGEITYHYKLSDLDSDWKTTNRNDLDYRSLPSGEYQLELYAVNKYGVKSNTITINFSVGAPFWKTIWFYLGIAVLVATIIVWIFNRRNKKNLERLEKRNSFQKQFAALEQQALQSQMNPHFIFNCLNSIQQYILTNEKEKANEYLTGFAALIRQTLDISAQQSITVSEEASYLKKYLEMERMRFGDSFTYTITVQQDVKADFIQMPALLLQPYVENSLRHGIRYKVSGDGKVEINFATKDNNLYCTIKDNGVGREKAAAFKSKQHIEYQSKGMNLTGKRIALLNAIHDKKITVAVNDLNNSDGEPAGTIVEIKISL